MAIQKVKFGNQIILFPNITWEKPEYRRKTTKYTKRKTETMTHLEQRTFRIISRIDRLETEFSNIEKRLSHIESINPHIKSKDLSKEKFDKLSHLIKEFENTYHVLEFRLLKSLELERFLEKLEHELRSSNEDIYLKRSIIVVRDVLRNNYIENLNKKQISTLIDVIKNIAETNTSIDKNQYRNCIKRLLQANLSILPTTSKVLKTASDVFGQ